MSHDDLPLPRRKPRVLRYIFAAFFLLFALFTYQLLGPNPPIRVSKQTTYITTPLLPSGLPDYRKYIHDKLSAGATPNNNAAVLLWQALGASDLGASEQAIISQELGVTLPFPTAEMEPQFGDRNRRLVADFLTKLHNQPFAERDDAVYTAIDAAMSAPWTSGQLPPMADWLRANARQLDLIVAAADRDHYYFPSATLLDSSNNYEWVGMWTEGVSNNRAAARALLARAMWHLGENRHLDAWKNLRAIHRQARILSQSGTIIDQLVAIAIDSMALDATATLLADSRLPADLARQIQSELESLPPTARMSAAFEGMERIWFVTLVMMAQESGVGTFLTNFLSGSTPSFHPFDHVSVDWNVALVEGNKRYDQIVAAFLEPDGRARRLAIDNIEADLQQMEVEMRQPSTWTSSLLSPQRRSQLVAATVITSSANAISNLNDAANRANSRLELTRLAATLAVYRAEQGGYPDDLSALVPTVLSQLPTDLFTGKPLVYHRTRDGYLLYSLGDNGFDDGGSNSLQNLLAGQTAEELGITYEEFEKKIPPTADDHALRVPTPKFKLPSPASN